MSTSTIATPDSSIATAGAVQRQLRRARGLTLAVGIAACGQSALPSSDASLSSTSRPAAAQTVTLLTGDRVTLLDGGRAVVTPGPARRHTSFVVEVRDRDTFVIPADVLERVESGQLDRALFDVSQLLAYGYGDSQREDLPLIVTGTLDMAGARRRMATADLAVDHALPALHAVAVRQRKTSGGAILAELDAAAIRARGSAATPQIWLDRPLRWTLDHSVPQIGGPAAHARGLTGAGVLVAVLDTGIDASHPDLAGAVVGAESFVSDGLGVSDVVGHGTHVASIIAGRGAASAGQFSGVAPEAELVSGRVCGVSSCPQSAILAGMEWAVVDRHARIINLSLGGIDSPGIDPVEAAVNQLSAQYGALFVVAAGNDGPGEQTIRSPGSADAALTVGAVDRDEQLARFSSRGPRVGDGAIKPDVTAPGVGIVAARAAAAGADLGEPVGTRYLRLSGTSMATPHVAGAAALVLQQHPGWDGAQLRSQLVATAQASSALTVFQQGTGRIDVDRATRQAVTPEPASLSFGLARWPHGDDPPMIRTVTYHNDGAAPVALALAASIALPDQRPAPAGMLRIDRTQLEVPAGGSASVEVTIDTRGDGADGVYTGALVATAGDIRIATAIAVVREVESYDLDLGVLGIDGAPATFDVTVQSSTIRKDGGFSGRGVLRLPRGIYGIQALVFDGDITTLTYPRLDVSRDQTVTLDARLAKPVTVAIPDTRLRVDKVTWGFVDRGTGLNRTIVTFDQGRTAGAGPEGPADQIDSWVHATMFPEDVFEQPAVVYQLAHREAGHALTGWAETIAPGQLATVHARHAASQDDGRGGKATFALVDMPARDFLVADFAWFEDYPGAFERIEHYAGSGFHWQLVFADERPDPEFPEFSVPVLAASIDRGYRPGRIYDERYNQAPFGSAFTDRLASTGGSRFRHESSAARSGDTLTVSPTLFADQSRPALRLRISTGDHKRAALFRDGELVAEQIDTSSASNFPPVEVPPQPATYRFEHEATRSPEIYDLSTEVRSVWTFPSAHVAGQAPVILPLPALRYAPAVDDHNRAPRVHLLPATVERPAGAATPHIAEITVEASFDDGATWSQVPAVAADDRWLGLVIAPRDATHVSLRSTARDVEGRRAEQTLVRAYRLRPR